MIKKIDHLVITTAQPVELISFYEKLGFRAHNCGNRWELFAGDFKINVHIKGAELFPHAHHIVSGTADLCFEIDQCMDDFLQALTQKGLTTELGIVPRNGTFGSMRSIYLRDPDQNLIEFCQYD